MPHKNFVRSLCAITVCALLGACAAKGLPYEPHPAYSSNLEITGTIRFGFFEISTFDDPNECRSKRPIVMLTDELTTYTTKIQPGKEIALNVYRGGAAGLSMIYGFSILKFTPEQDVNYRLNVAHDNSSFYWGLEQVVPGDEPTVVDATEFEYTTPWDDSGNFCKGNKIVSTSK